MYQCVMTLPRDHKVFFVFFDLMAAVVSEVRRQSESSHIEMKHEFLLLKRLIFYIFIYILYFIYFMYIFLLYFFFFYVGDLK